MPEPTGTQVRDLQASDIATVLKRNPSPSTGESDEIGEHHASRLALLGPQPAVLGQSSPPSHATPSPHERTGVFGHAPDGRTQPIEEREGSAVEPDELPLDVAYSFWSEVLFKSMLAGPPGLDTSRHAIEAIADEIADVVESERE